MNDAIAVPQKPKSYVLTFKCRNCAKSWVESIAFGTDVQEYTDLGGDTHVKKGWSTINPDVVKCPNCGSSNVRKGI